MEINDLLVTPPNLQNVKTPERAKAALSGKPNELPAVTEEDMDMLDEEQPPNYKGVGFLPEGGKNDVSKRKRTDTTLTVASNKSSGEHDEGDKAG